MLDDEFEDRLKDAARDYNVPPETPKDAMWAAIQAQRAAEGKEPLVTEAEGAERAEAAETREPRVLPFRHFRTFRPFRPVRLAAGIAAVLALGFALGRFSEKDVPPPTQVAAVAETPARPGDAAYRVATTEHLSQSETFLTLFRASVREGGNERLASATARQLLATNRLLLDSPAASDAKTRALLRDLELVLAEIAQLSPQPRSGDLELIKEGMEERGVMTRLRTAVPSGPSTTQGAL